LQIELDAFSGRPNPRWELTGAEAEEFLERLRALEPTGGSTAAGDGLGYRGFIARPNGEPSDGLGEIRIYGGTVLAQRGGRAERLSDPGRGLERWLLDTARGHVAEPVLSHVRGEIGR
jgi:hypothetical protein